MRRPLQPSTVLLLGLLTAQAIGTVQVYLSNISLQRTMNMLDSAGYLTVPNPVVAETLSSLGPALAGGLFFTLTVGAGLALAATGIMLFLRTAVRYRKPAAALAAAAWILSVAGLNARGFNPFATAYFVAIPAVVLFCLTGRGRPAPRFAGASSFFPHLIAFCALAAIWASQMGPDIFIRIRDRLLLPTTAGLAVNDFYYSYTLYPAYAFKTIEQRAMKACHLKDLPPSVAPGGIRRLLILHDFLPVEDEAAALTIAGRDGMLAFMWNGKELLREDPARFIASPGRTLGQVSTLADFNRLFRQFTFVSLLFAFPLLLYILTAAPAAAAAGALGLPPQVSSAALCFVVGLFLFIVFVHGKGECDGPGDVARAAASPRRQDRVAALETAASHGIDIGGLPSYERMKSSPLVVERYLVAHALGESRHPGTWGDLLTFLDDPHPNVVYTAFHSLGRRKRPEAAGEIVRRIRSSSHWYSQWYAYRALRSLGWSQLESAPGRS